MNLVSNAIKYKDEQKGDAAAVLVGAIAFPNRVRIDVVDNGVGIPCTQWGNIFKPFTQLNNPERDQKKASGWGCRSSARSWPFLAGHRLDMNSAEGKGTRFSVEVPRLDDPAAAVQAASTNPSSASLDLAGLYVLYVGLALLVRKSTALLFDYHGVLHEDVASVSELEERLPTLERMPDLIVTSYRLPDGRTAEEVLKAVWKEYETALPTIVLTGEALDLKPGTWISPEALGAAASARCLGPLLVKALAIASQSRLRSCLRKSATLSRSEGRSLGFRNPDPSAGNFDQQLGPPGDLKNPEELGDVVLADRAFLKAHFAGDGLIGQGLAQVVQRLERSPVHAECLRRHTAYR